MTRSAPIASLHQGLLNMFKTVRDQPGQWFTVDQLMAAGPVSRATAYRRCSDMCGARVLWRRRQSDQAEFQLHPRWAETPLGKVLQARLAGRS